MKKFMVAAAIMMLLGIFAPEAGATITFPRVSGGMLLSIEKVGCTAADKHCPIKYHYSVWRKKCYVCDKPCPVGGGCILASCADLYAYCEGGDESSCQELDSRCALKEP